MAKRCLTTGDQSSAAVCQSNGRSSVSGNNNEQPSVLYSEDDVKDTAVAKLEEESVKCGTENRTSVDSDTSASPVSPNTIYSNDFVFSTAKKSKVQRLELEPGLNRRSSSAENRNAAFGNLFESSVNFSPRSVPPHLVIRRDRTTNVESVSLQDEQLKADSKFYSVETELLTTGRRKQKKSVDQNIPKSSEVDVLLSLPQSGTRPQLKEEAAIERGRTSDSANSNLSSELRWINHSDARVVNEVPLNVPRRRGPRPKKARFRDVTKTCDADEATEASVNITFIFFKTFSIYWYYEGLSVA